MAEIISTEARAFANEGRAGLSYFAPNINIYRSEGLYIIFNSYEDLHLQTETLAGGGARRHQVKVRLRGKNYYLIIIDNW